MYHPLTEQELLRQCLAGNASAQYALYDRYVKAMYHVALRIVADTGEAEDVLQDSFVRIFNALPTFRGESTLGAWIRRIVVTTSLNHIGKRRLRFESIQPHHDAEDKPEADMLWETAQLHEAIKALPDGARIVFTLFVIEDMPHKEIAAALGITESTSKTQYMRAKQLLKKLLTTQNTA